MPNDRITYGFNTWNFVQIIGVPNIPQRKLKPIKMPGVWGKAFKFMSQEADPARLTLVAPAVDQADEEAWIASMAELTGRPVTVYSGTGVAYHNQIFHEVRHVGTQSVRVGVYGGVNLGDTGRLVTFEATLEYPYGS